MKKKISHQEWINIAATSIRNLERYKFFRDGAAERAAQSAFVQQEHGCGSEACISALCDSLNRDGHICYFDDPCDNWKAA